MLSLGYGTKFNKDWCKSQCRRLNIGKKISSKILPKYNGIIQSIFIFFSEMRGVQTFGYGSED